MIQKVLPPCYYGIAQFLPTPPVLGWRIGQALRGFLVRRLFQRYGDGVDVKSRAYLGDVRHLKVGSRAQIGKNILIDHNIEIGINSIGITPKSESSTSSRLRCLFAGRLIGLKGIHLAIAAIAAARSSGSDVTLTIVGRGPQRESLGKQVHQEGLDGHVTFIDWLDQQSLFEQYRHHDVLLFPSLHDSSGNVILEAFAHGLPAVCLNIGGPGEMVDETNGLSVDANSDPIRALSHALQRLASDTYFCQTLGKGARKSAETSSWKAVVHGIYQDVEQRLCK